MTSGADDVRSGALRAIPAPTALALLAIGFGVLGALAALSLIFDLSLYADGSFFCFGLGTADPWSHTWANYPQRFTAYAVTILPGHFVAQASGSLWWTVKAYGLTRALLPIASLAATALIAGWRSLLTALAAFSAVSFLALTVFFPTEVAITHAIFWPLLGYSLAARRLSFPVLLLFDGAFVFAHEFSVVLLFPLTAAAVARRTRRSDKRTIVLASLCAIAAWVAVKFALPPPNGRVAGAVLLNALEVLNLSKYENRVLGWMLGGWALCAVIGYGTGSRLGRWRLVAAVVLTMACLLAAYLVVESVVYAAPRYPARTFVFLWLAAVSLGACAASFARSERALRSLSPGTLGLLARATGSITGDPARTGKALLAMAVVSGGLNLAEAVRFADGWTGYGDELVRIGEASQARDGPDGIGRIAIGRPGIDHPLLWDWATPYHSLLLSALRHEAFLVTALPKPSSPLRCTDVLALRRAPSIYDARSLQVLERHVCRAYPASVEPVR